MRQIAFGHVELLIRVRLDARDGDGAADEVRSIWGAGDEVVADEDVPAGEGVTAGAEAGKPVYWDSFSKLGKGRSFARQ